MITIEDLQKVRSAAKGMKAFVIGDVMLDRYIYGMVERISPEAPVPVLTHQSSESKAGGAANVALNLASWGCTTSLFGLIGNDQAGAQLRQLLNEKGIRHILHESARPTTVKTRVIAGSNQLVRIDEESTEYLSEVEENNVITLIKDLLAKERPDLIIIEDYNKGLLGPHLIKTIIRHAKEKGIYVAVDPKERNFLEYTGADLFKPNLREANHATHRELSADELPAIASSWKALMNIHTIAITLGAQGIFLSNGYQEITVSPSRAIDVVDVCGAGDAVICALALGILSGLDLEKSGDLANLTGAYVCSHSGVVNIDPEELVGWI